MNALALALCLASTTATAAADPWDPAPRRWRPPTTTPHRQEHAGLYARAYLGPAYLSTSGTFDGSDFEIAGAGLALGLSVGYTVRPNLVVYGELFQDVAFGPTITIDGASVEAEDESAGVVGVGAGVAYWFVPIDVYVAGTLSLSQLSAQSNGEVLGESDVGPGVSLTAGKEWWVGKDVGLGVGVQVFVGRQPEKDEEAAWSTRAFALVGSLTYN